MARQAPRGGRHGGGRRPEDIVLTMGARMRGGPELTSMRGRAHAIEALTAVYTFHGHARAVHDAGSACPGKRKQVWRTA